MAALLTQPLWIVAAVVAGNSPVGIKLHPTKGGAQIQALVIDGRIIPIQALGPGFPARPLQQLAVLSKLN